MRVVTGSLTVSGRKRLLKELEILRKEDSQEIRAEPAQNANGDEVLDEWDVFIKGPPDSPYEGYVLRARMRFPSKYPFQPPTFCFITEMFHPNIYVDGNVCISILHTDGDDPTNMDKEKYTWSPSQSVRTICLSIISLLTEPNIYSPANPDASNMLRDHKEQYEEHVRKLMHASSQKAESAAPESAGCAK